MKRKMNGDQLRDTLKRGAILFAVAAFLIGSVGIYIFVLFVNENPTTDTSQQAIQQQLDAINKELPVDKDLTASVPLTSLQSQDLTVGTGAEAPAGATVKVKYRGALAESGKIFDQSSEPIELSLQSVIEGWKQGIPGMKEGGKRKLFIPAAQGYGESGTPDGTIPPNSDLVFEVELVEVK